MAKKLTKKDLEIIGVFYVGNKLRPNRFYIPKLGEVDLYEPYYAEDVLDRVYEEGFENGVQSGKDQKISEIKKVLKIEE